MNLLSSAVSRDFRELQSCCHVIVVRFGRASINDTKIDNKYFHGFQNDFQN